MKRITVWDFLKRNNYLLNETKIKLLKSLIKDSWIDNMTKLKSALILEKKLKLKSKSKIVNRCIVTGRGHSVLSNFWLSWMQFKEYAQQGLLPGIKKRNY